MISIPKAPFLTAISQVVPNGTRPLVPICVATAEKVVLPAPVEAKCSKTLSTRLPKTSLSLTSSITGSQQVRFAHSDIRFPDYNAYRRDGTKNSMAVGDSAAVSGRAFTYLLAGGGAVAGVYGGKLVVNAFIDSMSATADVLALAKVELNLADIPEGKNAALKWRGKPLFVRHRTAEEIETEQNVNLAELRDPQHDSDRTQKPEWLVLVGVCTHLGCVPVANAGEYGGYFCPCHGSHYDASGRIRKGPAPLNLEVPKHSFPDEETIVVG